MLIDEVLAYLAGDPIPDARSLVEQLKNSIVIKAQNVAEYAYQAGDDWGYDIESDFPNLAPPFDSIWMEWSHKSRWRAPDLPADYPERIRLGALLSSVELDQLRADPEFARKTENKIPPAAKWLTSIQFFRNTSGSMEFSPIEIGLLIPADGRLPTREPCFTIIGSPLSGPMDRELTDEERELGQSLASFLPFPFMAISLMHCKNVRCQSGPPIEPKIQKARERRGKPPLMRWKTLIIDPGKAVNVQTGSENAGSDSKALHICRGHYKRYAERGLFGRHTGTYWWPMQARGSIENGVIVKDYLVKGARS